MSPNAQLLRPVSQQEVAEYHANGVVCLRGILDPAWMALMRPTVRRIAVDKTDVGLLPIYPGRYLARTVPEVRRFIFQSPLGEAAAAVLGSRTVRFFFDEVFAKAPRSADATIWHTDRMGWPVTGMTVPSATSPGAPGRCGPIASSSRK